MTDVGGESPCWAHLLDELDSRNTQSQTRVDLAEIPDDGTGAVWSLRHGGDLDANLIRLGAGEDIGEHVNAAVDVLILVWEGSGELTIGDETVQLQRGVVALVPSGARRSIRARTAPIRYLTVHIRRDPLTIGQR